MKTVLRVVSLVWAGISLAAFGAAGDAYVWTGAVDGKWMNPKNWTLNGVEATVAPGVPSSEVDFGTSPKFTHVITDAGKARLGEKVTFGPIGTANTTIDLDGLYCIKDITIAAGAPTYTFGTSADQVLPLQSVGADVTLVYVVPSSPPVEVKLAFTSVSAVIVNVVVASVELASPLVGRLTQLKSTNIGFFA